MNKHTLNPAFLREARRRLLRMHFDAGVGHIGGNLSALDILLTLYHEVMTSQDEFILSKGHAAGALYLTLWTLGLLSDEELTTFHQDNTRLSGHPPPNAIPSIAFATGSLGHGSGLANGLALAEKLRGGKGHVFCLTSDGEWNEGSSWESLIFARHQRLNLTLIVDLNGLQGFGSTAEVANLDPLAEKFRAFGLHTIEVDGHDLSALRTVLTPFASNAGPRIVVAKTRKGCGVSFMENKMEWHYLPLNPAQYAAALKELDEEAHRDKH
jgi:transketolase